MKNCIKYLLFLIVSLFVACVKENESLDQDGLIRVPVSLHFEVMPIQNSCPDSKSILDPDDGGIASINQIKNFQILQFDGVSSNARLTGGSSNYFDHWPLEEGETVTLVASGECTVVILANVFSPVTFSSNVSLGDFLQQDYSLITPSGVLIHSGDHDYFRMSGSVKMNEVTAGSHVDVTLKRNVAKVVITVTNSAPPSDELSLSHVQLLDVNSKQYYLAHVAPALTTGDPSLVFSDPYNPAMPFRIDYSMEEFTGPSQTFTYYVPANLRGETSSLYQYSKGNGAPAGATKFRIYGTYGAGNTPINYTYYLGEDLVRDFNLKPNYKYTYNITIASKGNAHSDYRIEDLKEEVFNTDANCYMLQTPAVSGQSRMYSFPVRRAAVFWNTSDNANYQGLYGGSSMSGFESHILRNDTEWTAEILWSDFDMTDYTASDPADPRYEDRFLQVSGGTGFLPGEHTQPYLRFKVHHGMKGNVVVGMKVNGTILWSWHLWITDYDPDIRVTPGSGQYIYGAGNGEVHRYNNDYWNTGEYANAVIMDRNLGAWEASFVNYQTGLLYEFGRKDPFPASPTFYLNVNGEMTSTSVYPSSSLNKGRVDVNQPNSYNIRYTVLNPTVYIYSQSGDGLQYRWTSPYDDVGPDNSTSRWKDANYALGITGIHEANKSFYDPCPPGWQVCSPQTLEGSWIEMSGDNSASQTYTVTHFDKGVYYYPEGYVRRLEKGCIPFVYGYSRGFGGGSFGDARSGRIFTDSPTSTGGYSIWRIYYNDTTTEDHAIYNSGDGNFQTQAVNVRCVKK